MWMLLQLSKRRYVLEMGVSHLQYLMLLEMVFAVDMELVHMT